jgi:hypothetical protein
MVPPRTLYFSGPFDTVALAAKSARAVPTEYFIDIAMFFLSDENCSDPLGNSVAGIYVPQRNIGRNVSGVGTFDTAPGRCAQERWRARA